MQQYDLKAINKLVANSTNKVVVHWSRLVGQFLHKWTGKELPVNVPVSSTPGEWYETLQIAVDDLFKEMERQALTPLSETDLKADLYVSPEIATILEHSIWFRSLATDSKKLIDFKEEPWTYELLGSWGNHKVYMNPYHYTSLMVTVPSDPRSVLGVVNVHGFFKNEQQENTLVAEPVSVAKHDPNEAIRLQAKEPVAQTDYKTTDPNWINPRIPKADPHLRIKFKKMSETAKIPTAIRDGDIGFDLYCDEDWSIAPGMTVKIKTNIQLADMPAMDNDRNRIFMKIEGRSGLSAKGIFPTGGIIDPTYRGEIGVVMNCLRLAGVDGAYGPIAFNKGDRIAQLVVYKVATAGEVLMEETDTVTESVRGNAGFGSSGK